MLLPPVDPIGGHVVEFVFAESGTTDDDDRKLFVEVVCCSNEFLDFFAFWCVVSAEPGDQISPSWLWLVDLIVEQLC